MAAAAQQSGGSLSVHEVLRRWAPAYLERFGAALPTRQRQVLQRLLTCRTPALGGALYYCPDCDHRHFSYHSCNDRHCPQCGGQDAQEWLQKNTTLLLPVPYFLVTFTVPEGLRRWIRSHPQNGYDLLLAASSQALQDLAQNPKRLGASLGLLGVLHTWTRTLEYHPHIHYLVPGGGLSRDQRQWVPSRPNFLLPVQALSDRCRTLFHEGLQSQMPEALARLPPSVWKQRWVVHSAAVGGGQNALRYLSRYVFKTATGNRQLQWLPNGKLRWPFRHSATGAWRHVELHPFEFLRRFLQHVLPANFHRIRRFGWLHPAGRDKLKRVRGLLKIAPLLSAAEQTAWQVPAPAGPLTGSPPTSPPQLPTPATLCCPHCGQALRQIGQWPPQRNGVFAAVQRTTRPP
jgi:Putative transposase/Transposase zinc-binding domain